MLVCIALTISVAQHASSFHDRAPGTDWGRIMWFALLASPGAFARLLVMAPAIAVGIGHLGKRGVQAALGVVAATLLLMIGIDMWVGPAAEREIGRLARRVPSEWPVPGETNASAVSPMDSLGVLRTAASLLSVRPAAVEEHRKVYPAGHPRVVAAAAIQDAARFLLPFILTGIVVGITAWIRRRVIFRSTKDEVIARWFLAWVVAFAAARTIDSWSGGYSYRILFRDGSLWLPLVPYFPFLSLGVLGWRAAIRGGDSHVHEDIGPGHGLPARPAPPTA